ncbi:glycosyltransferase family 2 protein [Azohydromonas aeria]|uniref:glycosyltransferase family 2 protein n=1 Tax=Azohydromonas aeria TaxID=2590212 RepID=UPI0012FB46D7|nr:glycosyltransferase family A protein [Azohydromonas aeria]
MNPVEIAVVIPTYRRPDLLRRCLEALLEQSLDAVLFEVLVVDDGRSDDTRAVVEELAARPGAPALRYLQPHGTRGPAAARNRGWRATLAPIIAFTDDDTVPDRRWLEQGWRALGRKLAAASGRVVVPVLGPPTDHARMTQGLETAEFVTANAFVRRSALERVGGFDERFKRAWREDSDLQFSLLEQVGEVGRAAEAIVVHPVREARWGISLWQQENVCFDALLFKKHPHLFKERIRSRPPWRYVLIVLGTLAALGLALAGQGGAAALAALLALGGILGFAAKRLRGASRAPSHVAEMLVTSFAIPYLAMYWRLVGAWRFRVLFI